MRWRSRVLLVLAALLAAALARAGPSAPASAEKALKRVEAYNGRSFGNPGWRRVRLDLKTGGTVMRTFVVANVWREEGSMVRTVFVLESPELLKGTNYLLIEDPKDPGGMKVYVNLPTSQQQVLSIEPSYFDEGLLGSDFGYRDLRMKIPTAGFRFRLLGRQRLLGRNAWAVEALPAGEATRAASWGRSVYYLGETDPVLLGADHFQTAADRRPAKQMRVQGLSRIAGAWTETLITMTSSDGHSSVLSLMDFRAAVPDLANAFFTPESLPTVAERILHLRLGPKPPESPPGRSRP